MHSVSTVNTEARGRFQTLFALSAVKQACTPLTLSDPLLYVLVVRGNGDIESVQTEKVRLITTSNGETGEMYFRA